MTYEQLKVNRRNRLKHYVEKLGNKRVAEMFRCRASYISQLCSGTRPITERTARSLEAALGIRPKTLDRGG